MLELRLYRNIFWYPITMKTYKLAVTVPERDAEKLRLAISNAGGGKIGNYVHCSFSVKGLGRFTPQNGAAPAIGTVECPEEVAEERIEINCNEDSLDLVVKAIRSSHPYEEPVIDIYALV